MQLDYALNDTGIVDGNNLFFRTSVPQIIETPNGKGVLIFSKQCEFTQ